MKATRLFLLLVTACSASQGSAPYMPGDASAIGSDASVPTHPAGELYGSVLDERNDSIDFSIGEPVHTHSGAPIELGGGGCPAVYKYAYLESAQPPIYGSQTSQNPLAWRITSDVGSLDLGGTAYRVRDEANDVLLDWTPMTADIDGTFTIDLRRDGTHGVPAIGTQAGKMYVDTRFRDSHGADTIKSACWDNHPLAAPLQIAAPQPGDLFGMTFAAHGYISRALNLGSYSDDYGVQIVNMLVTQTTAEPVTFTLDVSPPTGTGTRDAVNTYLVHDSTPVSIACGSMPCAGAAAAIHLTGTFALNGTWKVAMIDPLTGATLCRSTAASPYRITCAIPGRQPGSPQHQYGVTLTLSGERSIAPFSATLDEHTFVDETIGTNPGKWFTGVIIEPGVYTQACSHNVPPNPLTGLGYTCVETSTYVHVNVANKAKLAFDAIDLTMSTAAGDTTTAFALPQLRFPATTWDAGDDGL